MGQTGTKLQLHKLRTNGRRYCRSQNKVGRTTFLALVGTFTKKQERPRGCIDYMVDTMIHRNFENVKNITNAEVEDIAQRDELLKLIRYVKEYLK